MWKKVWNYIGLREKKSFLISCNYTKKDVLETEQYEMLTGLVLSNLITSVDQTLLHPLIITEQKSFCTLDFS